MLFAAPGLWYSRATLRGTSHPLNLAAMPTSCWQQTQRPLVACAGDEADKEGVCGEGAIEHNGTESFSNTVTEGRR